MDFNNNDSEKRVDAENHMNRGNNIDNSDNSGNASSENSMNTENNMDTENSTNTENNMNTGNNTADSNHTEPENNSGRNTENPWSGNSGPNYYGNNNYGFNGYGNGQQNMSYPDANHPGGNSSYGCRYSQPYVMPGQKLANAAMILGIISILSTILMTIYIPLILGSIAIILAILSKGSKSHHMAGQAMTGLVCGVGGLVMNLGILITSLMFVFSHPELLQDAAKTYDAQFEQIYGESTEDIFGQSLEDMINETFGLE